MSVNPIIKRPPITPPTIAPTGVVDFAVPTAGPADVDIDVAGSIKLLCFVDVGVEVVVLGVVVELETCFDEILK
jgi:hypothetical protein